MEPPKYSAEPVKYSAEPVKYSAEPVAAKAALNVPKEVGQKKQQMMEAIKTQNHTVSMILLLTILVRKGPPCRSLLRL